MSIRDAERFKDKIEVSLDGRQIFLLFFGGAVLASLVFVLGVMVGRRLEGREKVARKAVTSAVADPLAALDELGADERADTAKLDDLAFPSALGGEHGERGKPLGAADVAPPANPHLVAPPVAAVAPPKPEAVPEAPAVAAPAGDGKKKFTLQISSFQDRSEADALAARLTLGGYQPTIVTSNVANKGIFFRVRVGEYVTKDAATVAKGDFEKKEHILAYVTKL